MVKNIHRRTQKSHGHMNHVNHLPVGDCCDTTFCGIGKWYQSMFETLGWMILAKQHGMTDKTTTYLNSIKRLKMAIEQKLKSTRDYDKKQDLMVMHKNVCTLMEHAEKDL